MELEQNRKKSNEKRTKYFNIKLFYITDLINGGETEIKCCPSNKIVADFFTKPIIGENFQNFCKTVMSM